MKTTRITAIIGIMHLLVLASASAQPPVAGSAGLTTESAAAGLQSKFREIVAQQSGVAWIGYEVPAIHGYRMGCGQPGDHNCLCQLEQERETYSQTRSSDSDLASGPSSMIVLYRIEDHHIDRIRCFSSGCRVDAGGLPIFWLTDVRPSESVALLESIIDASDEHRDDDVIGNPIMAIAVHSDPSAFPTLEKLVGSDRPEKVRKQAVFWLGQGSDPRAVKILDRVRRTDRSHEVREEVVFALSCSAAPGALDMLIRIAHEDDESDVRGNALFWLANKASAESAEAIKDAVENDPDAEVKEKAVFALSQLPKDRGVPLLIDVARTNRSPKVREQAIFWLGQSGDPRALDFFEEVLTH